MDMDMEQQKCVIVFGDQEYSVRPFDIYQWNGTDQNGKKDKHVWNKFFSIIILTK